MSDTPPEVSVSPTRKLFLSGASIVWLVPLLALVIALGVAWRSYADLGPVIVVEFKEGTGIVAGETELKYRDITVGAVERVGFTAGLERVTASIRVDKDVAPYIDSGSVFWIVQPEVTAQGISGLSTVLSGVYIQGSWDDQIGATETRFQGTQEPPLIVSGQGGLEIAFRTTANGQLTDNAPILYRGIEVGRVGRAKIDPRGGYAVVEALIFEEHRVLVNESTRFWDASGFSVNIGPAGAEINFSSLATLVGGGITFDTFVSGGDPVQDGTVFRIFPDEETARNSVFNASEVEPLKVSVIFDDNISGLVVGAPVELSGLNIGQVDTLAGLVDFNQFGDSRVRLNVILSIQPARLGLPGR
ncbi:intermembrane transport protein PqiB [Sulfitobacter aestuariivivens]|uniref:PqiB family protein n=1 Tax=Sulfitobacter aestuariivivens TaxID=2766981 RepID=UPI003621E5F6